MWQTDFTYFKIIGWGWYYLSTILDDYRRHILSWKLCTTMRAKVAKDTIELALAASGCDRAVVQHKPRLLSDNGPCYISGDLADWLEQQKMGHVRGALFHPQTQGKIERWHQTMKNRVCWKTITCPATLSSRSAPSSSITTIIVTTRALETSHPQMSTSDGTKPSSEKGKRSKNSQSKTTACYAGCIGYC